MFGTFKEELLNHKDGGYHHLHGAIEPSHVRAWFQAHSLTPPASYFDFLCQIGPGSFFAGSLTIYPLTSQHGRSVESELYSLRQATVEPIFPFGYDGTTESCYCFEAMSGE